MYEYISFTFTKTSVSEMNSFYKFAQQLPRCLQYELRLMKSVPLMFMNHIRSLNKQIALHKSKSSFQGTDTSSEADLCAF
jgi:hypothetical protein